MARDAETLGGVAPYQHDLGQAPVTNPYPYLAVVCVLAAIGTAFLPLADMQLRAVPEANVMFCAVVIIGDVVTALILVGQFRATGRVPLLVLGGAYFFTACIVFAYLLYFAEVAPKYGLFAGAPQSGAWLWIFWHLAFPAGVLAFVAAERLARRTVERWRQTAAVLTIGGSLAAGLGCTLLVTGIEQALPDLHEGRVWSPITAPLGWTMGLLAVAALVAVTWFAGPRKVIHLWVAVALVAFLFDIVPNIMAQKRFAFGWYAGRVGGVMAATALLVLLIAEVSRLSRSLAASVAQIAEMNVDLDQRVRERTAELAEANRALSAAVEQKQFLLHEVHHRVKNNLQQINSMIAIENVRLTDPQATRAMNAMLGRVQALSVVHDLLIRTSAADRVAIDAMLEALCRSLTASFGLKERGITLVVDAVSEELHLDRAIPIGMIVNELTVNAIKHAFPARGDGGSGGEGGRVDVRFVREAFPGGCEDAMVLSVSDNGIGADPGWLRWGMSTGALIVRKLAGQLGGETDVVVGDGTTVTIRMARSGG